ncbi:MAG TPA: FtsW/RodA/SpoVE family cell cycle protein, partial [bacterium]|nr:FtsW/RodA/SpoVE family cell cycle protein [bacterium]
MNDVRSDYQRVHMDSALLFCVIFLVGIGITMNYSASAVLSEDTYSDSYYYLKRSLLFASLGFAAMAATMKISYVHYRRVVYPILLVAILLVGSVFIPG